MTKAFDVPSFEGLFNSLPMRYRSNKVKAQLEDAYKRELRSMGYHAARVKKAKRPFSARMFLFDKRGGTQIIAEFWVKDLNEPVRGEYNWHLQNISQWVYAGCILFDVSAFQEGREYIISTHH